MPSKKKMEESQRKKSAFFREKYLSLSSSLSGMIGFLGGYQVCHNVCLGIIAALSLIGITVAGMPLLFLTKVAVPFWIAAVLLFALTFAFSLKMKSAPKNLLMINLGILAAAVPFKTVQAYRPILWVAGGTLIALGILSYVKARIAKKHRKK